MPDLEVLPGGRSWRVDDTTFVSSYGRQSNADRFHIRKPPDLVALYKSLAERFEGATVVELGIAAGGSTALLSLLLRPSTLVACELDPEPVAALSDFLARKGLTSAVQTFYGVDQGDRDRLVEIIEATLPGRQIDLVIDDASHQHDPTRASFEVLFPRLRPGGLFIIEDWAADYAVLKRDPSHPSGRVVTGRRRPAPAARGRRHRPAHPPDAAGPPRPGAPPGVRHRRRRGGRPPDQPALDRRGAGCSRARSGHVPPRRPPHRPVEVAR